MNACKCRAASPAARHATVDMSLAWKRRPPAPVPVLLRGGEDLAVEADGSKPLIEALDDRGREVVGHIAAEHRAAVDEQAAALRLVDVGHHWLHDGHDPRHGL